MELDADGLCRVRVRSQLLSGSSRRDLGDVVRTVVGVQAQDRAAAALAVRARRRGSTASAVAEAWGVDGPLVLTWSLRGTRHLHHVEDIRWLLELTGPVFAAGSPARNRQLGLSGEAGDRAVRTVRDALRRRGPLTRPEVKDLLARRGIDPSGQGPIHVIRRAALEGLLCVVPSPGGAETYVALDDRVPAPGHGGSGDVLAELARRFLRGYGPAGPADLAVWSGLPRRTADTAWSSIADELSEVSAPNGVAWMLASRSGSVRAAAGRPSPVRLLPAFDALLLGYADRSRFVPASRARAVNAGGGLIRPTVLADGGVIGTWSLRRSAGEARVDVTAFGRPGPAIRREIEREAAAVTRFVRRGS